MMHDPYSVKYVTDCLCLVSVMIELGLPMHWGGVCRYVCMYVCIYVCQVWAHALREHGLTVLGSRMARKFRKTMDEESHVTGSFVIFFALSCYGAAVKVKRWAVHVVRIRAVCFRPFFFVYHYRSTQHILVRIRTAHINAYVQDTGLPVCSANWQGWSLQPCQLAIPHAVEISNFAVVDFFNLRRLGDNEIISWYALYKGARCGAVGWGTAQQAGWSRVRFAMVSLT